MLLFEKSIAFSDQAVANTFFGRPVIKFTAQFKEVSIRRRLNESLKPVGTHLTL
jgi:glutamine phosphoribosylpyrophosphate amidotransferase